MKKSPLFIFILILLYCIQSGMPANAQNIHAIDVEKATDSYSRNNMYSNLNMFAELNSVFYFNSNDGIHGDELWRSDGTENGTWLVKDINPGTVSGNVNDIVVSGSKIFFSANDGINGQQLWVSDGTTDGTQMIAGIGFGFTQPNPSYITDINGTAFFVIDGNNPRSQLWKTDGTEAGTVQVADFDLFNPFAGSNIRYLTNVNGKLFFTANNFFSGPSLYVSDGSTDSTYEVLDSNFNIVGSAANLTAMNGSLYFSAYDYFTGFIFLWVSDGTSAGTHPVKNVNNIKLTAVYGDDNEQPFAVKDNTLFFSGDIATGDYELCKYDASNTANSVKLVKDVVPGLAGSYPLHMINGNGTIFFSTQPQGTDAELWKSDGTTAGTKLVKNINPGGINFYYGLVPVNNTLMFVYSNDSLGFELWKSDGTTAGTVLVKDIFKGVYNSFPQYLTYHGDQFLFTANHGGKGFELWKSDGTTAGTTIIKDINTSASSSSNPAGFTALVNNIALFSAYNNKYGFELWRTTGSKEGTSVVKDIYPGAFGSYPQFLTSFKNGVYFFAGNSSGYYLCKTNGTDAGTSLFYKLNVNGYVQNVTATDNLLYFTVFNYTVYRQELWRSDGTTAGTYSIRADFDPFFYLNPVGAGKTLFFVYGDNTTGTELWKSDGTTIGTKLVKDIYPGFQGSYPSNLYNFNGKLYFAADTGYGPFLWTSDGTTAGTKLLKAVAVQYGPFAQANGKLFFSAFSSISKGTELYATDGTAAGTKLVKDVNKGPGSSFPFALVSGDTMLYFQANYDFNTSASELWASNGTKEGTHLIGSIPQEFSSNPPERVNVNDILFFTNNDALWQSDATAEGTHQVIDPALDGASNIHGLSRAGNRLYFSAFQFAIGQELFTETTENGRTPVIAPITRSKSPVANAFNARILNNPIAGQLSVSVSVKQQQVVQVIITDASGRVLTTAKQILPPGTSILSYDAKGWTQGLYIIKITTADGNTSVLKALK